MTQENDTREDVVPVKNTRDELSVRDLARFLKRLSSFYRDQRFGHPALSDALGDLAAALDRRKVSTLTDAIGDIGR